MNHSHFVDTEKEKQQFFTDTLTNVLKQLAKFQENSCLQVVYNSVTFFIHFNDGKLVYATSSLAPFERLERHLRRLNNQNPKLDNSVIKQPRAQFRNNLQTYTQFPSDYQSILWLYEQEHLSKTEAIALLRRITREVFESFLCLPDSACQYRFVPKIEQITELCRFDLASYTSQCQKRLKAWNVFGDKIWSVYQRPYLVTEKTKTIGNLTTQQNQAICQLLKGLNFRQISAILDLDELVVAKLLYPSMQDKSIVLRDPKPPFDQLPKLPQGKNNTPMVDSGWRDDSNDTGFNTKAHSRQTVHTLEKTWKVVYVDDDSSIHQDFVKYLDPNIFLTVTIQDSLNAFAEIIEFNPDIIFLDADMPDLNGYELCELLRYHQDFKATPVILVEKKTKDIDLVKFKSSGATDQLKKPFTRIQLLSIAQEHLDK